MHNAGFVDLRVSPSGQTNVNEDSVWPSFTDVMTVIVMIFLLALVIILIRNMELVRQLRTTMAYEQQVLTERTALELKTNTLGEEVAALQLTLGETVALKERAEATSQKQQLHIGELISEVTALEQLRDHLTAERGTLTVQRDTLEGALLSLEQKHQSLESLRLALENEVAVLIGERTVLQDEKHVLIEQNTALDDNQARLTQEKTALLSTRDRLESKVTTLGNDIALLEQHLSEVQTQRDDEQRISVARQDRVETLLRDIAALEQVRKGLADEKENPAKNAVELQFTIWGGILIRMILRLVKKLI